MDSNKLLFICLLTISYLFLSFQMIKLFFNKHFKNIDNESPMKIYFIGSLMICSGIIGYVLINNGSQIFDLIKMASNSILLDLFKTGILSLGISLFWFWIVFLLNKIVITFIIPNFNLEDDIKVENNTNLLIFAISLITICIIFITILNVLLNFLTPLNQSIIYH